MYNHILVPTDGSRHSIHAAEHALDIADKYGAAVSGVFVVNTETGILGPAAGDTQAALETWGEQAIQEIESVAEDEDVELNTKILTGVPHKQILQYADETDVDLIVMGTHGRTGIGRYLLGSVTERVVRTADVPILTVRLPDEEQTVTDADQANDIARRALNDEGYADVSFPEKPFELHSSWVVQAASEGGTFSIYVDKTSEKTHIVPTNR